MSDIVNQLSSPSWWVSSVIVALLVNVASAFLFERLRSIKLPSLRAVEWILFGHAALTAIGGIWTGVALAFFATTNSEFFRWVFAVGIFLSPLLLSRDIYNLRKSQIRAAVLVTVFAAVFALGVWYFPYPAFIPMVYWYASFMGVFLSTMGLRPRSVGSRGRQL